MAIDFSILESNSGLILFLFALAIMFGVLDTVKIIKNRAANFLISLAIALFAVSNPVFIVFVEPLMGFIAVFFIVMFLIIFIFKVFGVGKLDEGVFINGAILLILLVFGFMHADLIPILPIIGSGTNLVVLVAMIFILIIFWMAFKTGREEHPGQPHPQAQPSE